MSPRRKSGPTSSVATREMPVQLSLCAATFAAALRRKIPVWTLRRQIRKIQLPCRIWFDSHNFLLSLEKINSFKADARHWQQGVVSRRYREGFSAFIRTDWYSLPIESLTLVFPQAQWGNYGGNQNIKSTYTSFLRNIQAECWGHPPTTYCLPGEFKKSRKPRLVAGFFLACSVRSGLRGSPWNTSKTYFSVALFAGGNGLVALQHF